MSCGRPFIPAGNSSFVPYQRSMVGQLCPECAGANLVELELHPTDSELESRSLVQSPVDANGSPLDSDVPVIDHTNEQVEHVVIELEPSARPEPGSRGASRVAALIRILDRLLGLDRLVRGCPPAVRSSSS